MFNQIQPLHTALATSGVLCPDTGNEMGNQLIEEYPRGNEIGVVCIESICLWCSIYGHASEIITSLI